ncbi:MAG: hypothetical protein K2L86_00580 [Lachnospiraceae bacterium]|nr:hypothetical protein [Lachnospiraceae bacterium]
MKKTVTAACMLLCALFLCSCTIGQDGKKDLDDAEREGKGINAVISEETVHLSDVQTDNTPHEMTSGNEQTAGVQDGGDTSSDVQMQGLMQGNLGSIGSGALMYTLPQQDGEDYKLCFFKEGGKVSDFGKTMSEVVYYPLEMADYIFPDVRSNNIPIGKFVEIYFFDTVTIGEDRAAGLVIVASYDVNGEMCYDTRIYRWNGTSYSAEVELMQEFNEQYSNAQNYPVEELYYLSLDTSSQSIMPIGENQTVEGQEQDYYGDLIAAARGCVIKNNGEVPEGYDFSSVIFMKKDWDYGILGYLIEDLNGDGTEELIFGANVSDKESTNDVWNGIVYDVYTVSDGKLVHVLDGWERNRYYLCGNGMIANEGSGGAANSNYSYYTFDGLKLNLVESVLYDAAKDTDHPWFYSKESEYDADSADPISEGQAEEIRGKYTYLRPRFIPFTEG